MIGLRTVAKTIRKYKKRPKNTVVFDFDKTPGRFEVYKVSRKTEIDFR